MRSNSLRLIAFAVHAALLAGVAPAVLADDTTPPAGTAELGKISVTAQVSAAERVSLPQVGPMQVISNAQLKATGFVTVGDVLQSLTIMGSGINPAFNASADGGETCINLRNLGCNRVLVLVNGRRWPELLTGEVDLTTIPLSMVDHVEILKSGGSAEYGSDAISGVVNVVTKRDFNDSEASAYLGEYVEGGERDGQTSLYEFTHGRSGPDSSVVFNASYSEQRPILGGERDISSVPDFGTGVTRGSSVVGQGRFTFINPNTGKKEDLTVIPGTPGTSPADFETFDPTTELYNFAPLNYLLTPSKRTSLYVQGRYDFSDDLGAHYTALYNDRRSDQQSGPAEINIGSQGTNPISVSATNPYNPFGFDLTATGAKPNLLLLDRQPVEIGPRAISEDAQLFYFDAGINGDFDLATHPFTWSVDALLDRSTMTTLDGPEINLVNLANALGPIADCGPGSVSPSCVPLNVFGGLYNGGTITPAMIKYITYNAQSYLETDQRDYNAKLSTPLVDLPAGPLRATLGYEYLSLSGESQPDALAAVGESSVTSTPPVSGGYNASAESLEFNVPLLADSVIAKSLALDAATRHSDYSSFGTRNSNVAALHWTVSDAVAFRGSWSQDFRAPDMSELFTSGVVGTASVADPCSDYAKTGGAVAANCAAAGVPAAFVQVNPDVTSTTGSNPNLGPETSTSRTLGTTLSPWQSVPLTLSADYFKIEVDNAITTLNPQTILDGCYADGLSSYCSFVQRNASGAITDLLNTKVNVASLYTEGADFDARYTLQTQASGSFGFDWQTTWVKLFTQVEANPAVPSAPIITQLADTETGKPVGGYPKFKSQLQAEWTYSAWQLTWRMHYISDLSESCSDRLNNTPESLVALGLCSYPDTKNQALSRNKLGATTWNDVQAQYAFANGKTTLTFGVLNVFDKEPPIGHSMSDSFDVTLYPIPGRFPYISISQRF